MTKPTGRPRGRPKTNYYETLTARFPAAFVQQVRAYAAQHRQSLSDLIRDGLDWRLGEGDPYSGGLLDRFRGDAVQDPYDVQDDVDAINRLFERLRPYWNTGEARAQVRAVLNTWGLYLRDPVIASDNNAVPEIVSDRNGGLSDIPSDTNTQDHPDSLSDTNQAVSERVSDKNTEPAATVSDGNTDLAALPAAATSGHVVPPAAAPTLDVTAYGLDPTKWRLGGLCKRGHEYEHTGKTLYRLPGKACPACDAARTRARRAAKKQAQATLGE
jgi:hypothetical protein